MTDQPTNSVRNTVALILVVSLVSGGAAAAVTITTLDTNPVSPGAGSLSEASDLSINSTNLVYEGTNVTAADVTVNNSASADSTVNIHVALKTSTGTAAETQTLSGKTVTASSSATFNVSFSSTPGVDEFSDIEVTVEQTA